MATPARARVQAAETQAKPIVAAPSGQDHTDQLAKHLEFIQGVVNRLAGNSFLLKGWSVTLTAALVGFSAKEASPWFAVAAILPSVSFWALDAYYLRQERLFRALYDAVRTTRPDRDPGLGAFTLDTRGYESQVKSLPKTLFAPTIFGLHGITTTVAVGAAIIIAASQRAGG